MLALFFLFPKPGDRGRECVPYANAYRWGYDINHG